MSAPTRAPIQRRKSKRIYVGNVPIGDGAPIAVQSMTNTRTTDVAATVNQIKALERVGDVNLLFDKFERLSSVHRRNRDTDNVRAYAL